MKKRNEFIDFFAEWNGLVVFFGAASSIKEKFYFSFNYGVIGYRFAARHSTPPTLFHSSFIVSLLINQSILSLLFLHSLD